MTENIPPLVEVIEFLSAMERGDVPQVTVEMMEEQLVKLDEAKKQVDQITDVSRRLGLDSVIERLENRIYIIADGLKLVTHSKEFDLDSEVERFLEGMAPSDREWYLQQKAMGKTDEEIIEMLMGRFSEEKE